MSKALPYLFLLVLAMAIVFMAYGMNDMSKLGNTISVSEEMAK